MPGYIVHLGATVRCFHNAPALPTRVSQRVFVSGLPVVTLVPTYSIAGCPHSIPAGPSPCATGKWTSGSTRVFASRRPLVLVSSTSVCVPNGTPMKISKTQKRVTAT